MTYEREPHTIVLTWWSRKKPEHSGRGQQEQFRHLSTSQASFVFEVPRWKETSQHQKHAEVEGLFARKQLVMLVRYSMDTLWQPFSVLRIAHPVSTTRNHQTRSSDLWDNSSTNEASCCLLVCNGRASLYCSGVDEMQRSVFELSLIRDYIRV